MSELKFSEMQFPCIRYQSLFIIHAANVQNCLIVILASAVIESLASGSNLAQNEQQNDCYANREIISQSRIYAGEKYFFNCFSAQDLSQI